MFFAKSEYCLRRARRIRPGQAIDVELSSKYIGVGEFYKLQADLVAAGFLVRVLKLGEQEGRTPTNHQLTISRPQSRHVAQEES